MTRHMLMLALATTALAACQDGVTAPAGSPAGAAASRDLAAPYYNDAQRSLGSIVPLTVAGNTTHSAYAICPSGSVETKVEGSGGRTIGGFVFTTSQGGTRLAFTPGPGAAGQAVTAVFVKGGASFNVYTYVGEPEGTAGDGGLVSPLNGGGNVPQISHYSACIGVAPFSPSKTLFRVFHGTGMGNVNSNPGSLIELPYDVQGDNDVQTRWMEYRINFLLPSGQTAIIRDVESQVCAGIRAAGYSCSFDPANSTGGSALWSANGLQVTGTGQPQFVTVMIDLINMGACADFPFTNTATITPTGGQEQLVTHTVTVRPTGTPLCQPTKTLDRIWFGTGMSQVINNPGAIIELPYDAPGDNDVQTRWVQYHIRFQLAAGQTATVHDIESQVCAGIRAAGYGCSFDPANSTGGSALWSANGLQVTGTGQPQAIAVMIDITNTGACGDVQFTNTASIAAGGQTIPVTHTVTLRPIGTPGCTL